MFLNQPINIEGILGKKTYRSTSYEKIKNTDQSSFKLEPEDNTEKDLIENQIKEKMRDIFGTDFDNQIKNINNFASYDGIDFQLIDFKGEDYLHQHISKRNFQLSLNEQLNIQMAKNYNFKLDNFQKRAILCMEHNQSVMIAAPTSAGKSAIAEYAIALAIRNHKKAIYTSPIKALSNQKFRDFKEEGFTDIGLMTGDVTINPTAQVLVMTTEILRNMLYDKSKVIEEIGWVIFDEIHYMKDKIRGVVWEETIILLPNIIRYVFLSATIPNSLEFASWIFLMKNEPMNVVFTEKRPVPITYSAFFPSISNLILKNIIDLNGKFDDYNWDQLLKVKKQNNFNF